MAQRDRSVCIFQQIAHGTPDDITATENDGLLARAVNTARPEELHHRQGRAGDEQRLSSPLGQLPDINRAETINILLVRYGGCNRMLGQVLREGELDEDAVYGGVVVGFGDFLKNLGLGDVFGEVDCFAENVCLHHQYRHLYQLRI